MVMCTDCDVLFKVAKTGDETLLTEVMLAKSHYGWTECRNRNYDNLLHIATRYKQLKFLRKLFDEWEARSHVNVGNKTGKTPLHEAAQICSFDIVHYLLLHGSDPNALTCNGWTPLMLAASKLEPEAFEIMTLLIKFKADPFIQNKDGWTVLHIACRNGDTTKVDYFMTSFPNLFLVKSKNGRYPLHTAALYGHCHLVELFLKAECGIVSACDLCGTTPIHEAARSNHCDIIKILIDKGASIYELDMMGLNCLHMAAQAGAVAVIVFLIRTCNMDVNTKNALNNFTPLHYASQAGQFSTVKELLKLGADPRSADSKGRLPWEISYGNNCEQLLKIIQEHECGDST